MFVNNNDVSVNINQDLISKDIGFVKEIDLKYAQNAFTIQYAAVDLYGNVQYAYRLIGFEDEWQNVKTKTEANYTNIPPGDYTFQVKAVNHQGYWSEVRELAVHVKAPWYRTWLAYFIYALLIGFSIWGYVRYRSRSLIKEKEVLEDKVARRTNELAASINELKSTQAQLIQSEKMASLGQLTAGIAHEIQNPLNFVNNFSDVNTELLAELKQELSAGTKEDAAMLIDDIMDNEKKINHHGKRADSIVKGMLQHSRAGMGEKSATDLNVLADEYLRLSYHGFRSKDKDFNVMMTNRFNENVGKLNIVPQDIGRVLLNLFNNAFYAMAEKKRANPGYSPEIIVSTFRKNGGVEISVKDNGNGIPEKITDKIFQPFFTTKPTGDGTGLGLSLAYDIMKAHGGEINVNTIPGESTEFVITLPANI